MRQKISFLLLSVFFLSACSSKEDGNDVVGALGTQGAVSTAHPIASQVGLEVLKQGGNAFDAAVAIQFALAVVYPRAGNIGGGGFAVYRLASGESGTLDFREKAPANAHKDMYLDEEGTVIEGLSRKGALAAGVPGSVAGMYDLHQRFGSMGWQLLLIPSIQLARNGVPLTKDEAAILNEYKEDLSFVNNFSHPFEKSEKWREGDSLFQKNLANTLLKISNEGKEAFYKGAVADAIVVTMKANGGIITKEDLSEYNTEWRAPVRGSYKAYSVITMPPPSSGGIALLQLLKGVENYPIKEWGHNTAQTVHVMTELERRVYADRATYLGDPDYFPVPVKKLLDSKYLKDRFATIDLGSATSSQEIKEGEVKRIESIETTHFSIVDREGNAVAITTTLNGNFGSKLIVKGAGFILNNEMDDFSVKAGVPNMYGLVGSEANEIAPGKRMLSSMTPTIVEKEGDLFLVVGTPGGSTIITSVFQTVLNVLEFDMPMQGAINARRIHHQWLPNYVLTEKAALKFEALVKLFWMGHKVIPTEKIGRVDGILVRSDGTLEAGADYTRGDDTALAY